MSLILDALSKRISHAGYYVSSLLTNAYPGQAVIEGRAQAFNLLEFAAGGQCTLQASQNEHSQLLTHWVGESVARSVENTMFDVQWDNERLTVLFMSFQPESMGYYWIVARTREVAEKFFVTVCRWCAEVRGEILVFAGGQFYKDDALYREIKNTSLNDVILSKGLKDEIAGDIRQFFKAKPMFDEYRIPWKRGILFLGPPGNGKTLTIKALVSELGYPCIYVKSFDLPMNAYPQAGINAVFARARQTTPCILVLEDLDALIGDHNRSFFLNELDGFASNAGIVTIATSNHPERLDPSILERPSRFDRKYHFELPERAEREAYVQFWNATLADKLTLDQQEAESIAEETEGFSFAYIKELFLSAMMRWASENGSKRFGAIALAQIEALRSQMTTSAIDTAAQPDPSAWFPFSPHIMRMIAMRGMGVTHPAPESTIEVVTD